MGAATTRKNKHREKVERDGTPIPRQPMVSNEEKRAQARNPLGPKTKPFGNAEIDRNWLQREIDVGRLWSIDPAEWDLPWDSWYMHDDDSATIFESWEKPHFKRKDTLPCSSIAYIRDQRGRYVVDCDGQRLYRPCYRPAMYGQNNCEKHGGAAPAMRAKAHQRLTYAADRAAAVLEQMLASTDENGTPVDPRDRIKAASMILDRAGVGSAAKVDLNVKAPAYEAVLSKLFESDAEEGEESDG